MTVNGAGPVSPPLLAGPYLVINEVEVHDGRDDDQYELYNAGDEAAVGECFCGWYEVGPGAFIVIESAPNCDFGLESSGSLAIAERETDVLLDSVSWTEFSPEGGSYGRLPDGTGEVYPLLDATPGNRS